MRFGDEQEMCCRMRYCSLAKKKVYYSDSCLVGVSRARAECVLADFDCSVKLE